jgi:hypothetical protein
VTYFLHYIIAFTAFGGLLTVAQVGKYRTPITPGVAALTVIWAVANIIGYIWVLGRVG